MSDIIITDRFGSEIHEAPEYSVAGYNSDPSQENLIELPTEIPDFSNPRIALIRSSDRANFKRCRRKWDFESGLRKNLTMADRPSYFWIGTGGHFALEDWHGYNYYGSPIKAFEAYCDACVEAGRRHRVQPPDDYEEQRELGIGILTHYMEWCRTRDAYETVWIDGKPQVEVKGLVKLPFSNEWYDEVYYSITLDRLVEIDGEYWIQDWKFFKQFSTTPLAWHGQLSAYIWASQTIWDVPIAGGILHEFKKTIPGQPRILLSGEISTAKDQNTTHGAYRQALIDKYGAVNKASKKHIDCLNNLAQQEHEDSDKFIRRAKTRRTEHQIQAEGSRIMMELEEMLNHDTPLYINPTKDCSWDCGFRDICLMMDRDDDWSYALDEISISRDEENEEWRNYLK